MNYRIVYLFSGDVKKYVEKLIKDVCIKFGVKFCYLQKQPPHLTLKYRFKTDNIEAVEKAIQEVCQETKQSEFEIGGSSYFGTHAVILKVKPSKEIVSFEKKLIKKIYSLDISNDSLDCDWDKKLYKNFHVGIAHHDIEKKFSEIKSYLKSYDKKFKVKFDKVYLVGKLKKKWIIQTEFNIR